jgi:CubicO group peptidase (beta-lactamase class C family)
MFIAAGMAVAGPSAQVDIMFEPFTEGVRPGAAVMVIRNGEIVHSAGYGYANLEEKIPIEADSIFRLGSVSKQFTAMAIMVLAERGKLAYDDPVSRYVPELERFGDITVRHLLTHTSGLPDYYDDIEVSGPRPSNADVMKFLSGWGESEFTPGARHEYSNPGYEALTQVVVAASGQSFASFMRENVFKPAGMQDSLIHDHTEPVVPRRVLGYSQNEAGDGFDLNDDDPLNGITGSGSQFSPLDDFFHWDQALYGEALVRQATLKEGFTRGKTSDGAEFDYGFGWRLDSYRGQRRIAHGGSWVGFRTAISRYPDIGLTVVVLMNFAEAEPGELSDRIADIYLDSG